LEEVTVHAGHKVLMGVDDNILLIVGDPQGFRTAAQASPNVTFNIILYLLLLLFYF
jgi:hypothetical protein